MKRWSTKEDRTLLDMTNDGASLNEISRVLNRTKAAVSARKSRLVTYNYYEGSGADLKTELLRILKSAPSKAANYFRLENNVPSYSTYIKYFGTWDNVLKEANIPANTNSLSPELMTTLYLVEFDGFYKIGITQRSLDLRFSGYPKYSVILKLNLSYCEAIKLEKDFLTNVKEFSYRPPLFLIPSGGTECFKYG
jgi:hypothetical protein